MAKKTKTTRKQTKSRSNRGKNVVETAQMGIRISTRNIQWLNDQSKAAQVSRSAFLDKLIDSLRETQGNLTQAGIFDMYQPSIDRLIDQVVQQRLEERTK